MRIVRTAISIVARAVGMAALLAAASARSAAQPAVGDAPVSIEVTVLDSAGWPVPRLSSRDFTLLADGAPVPFDVRAVDASPEPRLFAFLLDEFHVAAGDATRRVRDWLRHFADTALRAGDRVIVLTPLDSIRAIRPLTDVAAVRRAFADFDGRRGDHAPRTAFERAFMSRAPEAVDRERARITFAALQALIEHTGMAPSTRRMAMIVSEGFVVPPPDRRTLAAIDATAVGDAALRAGVTVHTFMPREPAAGEGALVTSLATRSGGTVVGGGADLDAMTRVASDAEASYVVSFRPPDPTPGFHRVEVEVKRRSLRTRARAGYWIRPVASPPTAATVGATALPPRLHRSPFIRSWVGVSRGESGRTRLTVTWEPDGSVRGKVRAEAVTLKATTDAGLVLFEAPLGAVRPGAPGLAGPPSRAVFEAPPGQVALEMAITANTGGALDADVRTVTVPDLHAAALTLATPEVFRARTAREFAALAGNPDAAPVTSRTFSRAERLLIRVSAYGAGPALPDVAARLLNARGETLRRLPVQTGQGDQAPPSLRNVYQVDVPLAWLAPAEYRLELTARDGGREVTDTILFRIVG